MKKCKYCKQEVEKNTKICPICKKKQNNISKKILIIFLCLILILIIISLINQNYIESQEKLVTIENDKGLVDETGFYYKIIGEVNNNSKIDFSHINLEYTVYDNFGNSLGTCLAFTDNLISKTKWNFTANCIGIDPKSVKSYKPNSFIKIR